MNSKASSSGDPGASSSAPLDVFEARMKDGATIFVRRMSAHPSVRLILSHGNGLAIDGYESYWRQLLPAAEIIVFDFRNHGWNPSAPPADVNNWQLFVSDMDEVLRAIDERFGRKTTFGAFHSMSALTTLICTARHHFPWKGLVLFEPPAVPPDGQERIDTLSIHDDLGERTRKRRAEFTSPEQLAQSFARLLMFQRMPAAVRLQLAASTLRQTESGSYQLRCPPGFEGDTFRISALAPHWEEFSRIACPVTIVSSTPEDSDMPVLARISRRLAQDFDFDHVEYPAAGHMVQLDHAADCAKLTLDFIAKNLPGR